MDIRDGVEWRHQQFLCTWPPLCTQKYISVIKQVPSEFMPGAYYIYLDPNADGKVLFSIEKIYMKVNPKLFCYWQELKFSSILDQ